MLLNIKLEKKICYKYIFVNTACQFYMLSMEGVTHLLTRLLYQQLTQEA